MYELYFQHFNKRVPLSNEEEEVIKGLLSVRKLRKRQLLLQEGDICRSIAFVQKGLLRLYHVNEDGSEHIVRFAVEELFITDLYSFLTQKPTSYCIDAIENSELVIISRAARDKLIEISPKYVRYMLQILGEAYIDFQERITSSISMSLEERYKFLLSTCPGIALRAPQHMIASYMGLTPETLSRVRHRIADSR